MYNNKNVGDNGNAWMYLMITDGNESDLEQRMKPNGGKKILFIITAYGKKEWEQRLAAICAAES